MILLLGFILTKIQVIVVLATLILIVPLIIGTINFKEIKNTPLLIIFIYLIIYALFEIIAWYYALHHLQNHFLGNLISYLDVIFFGWYYYLIISSLTLKRMISIMTIIGVIIIFWSHLDTVKDFNRFDSFALSIKNISIISMVLVFFYQMLNTLEIKNLFTYAHFWIGIAVLLFFSVVFFVNIFAEYITFNKDASITQYWDIKQYLTFFHRIFLAIGLWFSTTPIQSNLSSK